MSGFTTTPNYNLRKPIVGADNDLWGGDWNINADTLDALLFNRLPLAGGTATGQINAPAFGVTPNDVWGVAGLAADMVWSIRDAAGNVPLALMADGTLLMSAVATPTAPAMPVTKAYGDANYVPAIGGTMQGPLGVRSNAVFDVPIDADLAFSIRDALGNIALAVDMQGNLLATLKLTTALNLPSATITALTYTDLIATPPSDWLTGYSYDWTISDGTHLAAGLLKDGRLRARLSLETQTLTLTGTNLATAYQLDPCIADVVSCAAGGGVQLKRNVGSVWYIQNSTAAPFNVWPSTGAQIGASAIGAPVTIEAASAVILWQPSTAKYSIVQAGAGGGGSMVFTGTGFANPRDLHDRVADTVNVNDLVAGIDPTGAADNSTQVKAAHDLAYSLGYRYLYFPKGKYHAPFGGASAAPQIANVIFVGENATIDCYRKYIVPLQRKSFVPPCDLNPGHVPKLTAAVAAASAGAPAKIVMVGDSTLGTPSTASSGSGESWNGMLSRKIAQDFAAKPVVVIDRGIGGTAWLDIARNGPPFNHYGNDSGSPTWWAAQYEAAHPGVGYTRRWIEYLVDLQPVAAIYFMFGFNDNSKFDIYTVESVMAEIRARFSPVPDVFLSSNGNPQLMDSFSGTKSGQEARDFAAGYQRTWARRNGLGLLDYHRQHAVMRDGFDPVGGIMQNFIDGFAPPNGFNNQLTTTTPWTYPNECLHFACRISFGSMLNVFSGGRKLKVLLSSYAENVLTLEQDVSGKLAYSVLSTTTSLSTTEAFPTTGPYYSVPRTISTFDMTIAGTFALSLDVRDGHVYMLLETTLPNVQTVIVKLLCDRYGGVFRPSFSYDNGAAVNITVLQAAAFMPDIFMPQLIDVESLDWSLHPTRYAVANVAVPIIAAQRFV